MSVLMKPVQRTEKPSAGMPATPGGPLAQPKFTCLSMRCAETPVKAKAPPRLPSCA